MNRMNGKQKLFQNTKKRCDARWHHLTLILIQFKSELKNELFTQLHVLNKIFILAPWCDVCALLMTLKIS